MIYLSDKSTGRDNNFNLIRALAATAVLVSHAYPIAQGPEAVQPLEELTGHTLGTLAVYAFFCISGFLITKSFQHHANWLGFLVARVLRLAPALIVSLVVVSFILGPIVTTLSPGAYFGHRDVYTFLIGNSTLVFMQYDLPGVFDTQPYGDVEGSIWTLFYEVVCYFGVFALGLLGILQKRLWMSVGFALYLVLWFWAETRELTHFRLASLHDLALPFVIGMMKYLWQEQLPLTWIAIGALAALTMLLKNTPAYDLAIVMTLSYALFWLAYIPDGTLRAYNRIGDYSYGIYIYAFPFQGLAVWLAGGGLQSQWLNMAISFPLTLTAAVISWHLIEAPALTAKLRVQTRLIKHAEKFKS